jgi:NAD(P)-dependent dehydrogenase (short-subunit alcohol dehydrogenase family)
VFHQRNNEYSTGLLLLYIVAASLSILSRGILPNSFSYNTSKTANNAILVGFARELKGTNAQIYAVTPGPTSTDLNDHYALGKTPA